MLTNDIFAGLNPNRAHDRRVRDLLASYLARMDNPIDPNRQADARIAAEFKARLEREARTGADLDALVRMQGAVGRAERKLGIKLAAAPKPPTLAEYVAAKRAT